MVRGGGAADPSGEVRARRDLGFEMEGRVFARKRKRRDKSTTHFSSRRPCNMEKGGRGADPTGEMRARRDFGVEMEGEIFARKQRRREDSKKLIDHLEGNTQWRKGKGGGPKWRGESQEGLRCRNGGACRWRCTTASPPPPTSSALGFGFGI